MRQAIETGEIDLVVVHELSRLSRLGGAEIHMFLEHAIEHETSVKDLEVGLAIDVDDSHGADRD
jgi:DNA invertase Pin-like site-specific DNA recombinase